MGRLKAIAQEQFGEYIIITRCEDGSDRYLSWAYSDPQWAYGAMDRVKNKIKELQSS